MEEVMIRSLYEENLIICINKLRDVLNEMCSTIDETEARIETLIVSQQLDELIVEYMSIKRINVNRL